MALRSAERHAWIAVCNITERTSETNRMLDIAITRNFIVGYMDGPIESIGVKLDNGMVPLKIIDSKKYRVTPSYALHFAVYCLIAYFLQECLHKIHENGCHFIFVPL